MSGTCSRQNLGDRLIEGAHVIRAKARVTFVPLTPGLSLGLQRNNLIGFSPELHAITNLLDLHMDNAPIRMRPFTTQLPGGIPMLLETVRLQFLQHIS